MPTRMVMVGLAFWLLLAPGDKWSWVIVGGHESRDGCEEERLTRLDGDYLVCATVRESWGSAAALTERPHDVFPSLGELQ